jgi:hypothetical protein
MTKLCDHFSVDLDFTIDHAESSDWVYHRGVCMDCGQAVEARYQLVEVEAITSGGENA